MGSHNSTVLHDRELPNGLTNVEIEIGYGLKASRRYKSLTDLMPRVQQVLEDYEREDLASVLRRWMMRQHELQQKVAPNWELKLSGEQWAALSFGLRHSGTAGMAMYQWLCQHRLCKCAGSDVYT